MEQFILWCGFAGAWLLVAGPAYQAALELHEQDMRREHLEKAVVTVGTQPRVSAWWWLLPPVHYWLQRRESTRYRERVLSALTPEELDGLVQFIDKATGWMFVGLGGLLLAAKETWELCEHNDWPLTVYWPLIAFMGFLCALNTVLRTKRSQRVLERRRA